MKRKGLPAHVEDAINRASPQQLEAMLDIGRPKAKRLARPKPPKKSLEVRKHERLERRAAFLAAVSVIKAAPGVLELSLHYPISANVYWRSRVIVPRHGAPFVSTYVSEEAVDYKDAIARRAKDLDLCMLLGEVDVEIHLYRPQRSGDADNRTKVLFDALQGIAFPDDKQIAKYSVERHEDKVNPRAVVRVVQRAADLFGGTQ